MLNKFSIYLSENPRFKVRAIGSHKQKPGCDLAGEIDSNIKEGPSTDSCVNTGEIPPYLDEKWWYS